MHPHKVGLAILVLVMNLRGIRRNEPIVHHDGITAIQGGLVLPYLHADNRTVGICIQIHNGIQQVIFLILLARHEPEGTMTFKHSRIGFRFEGGHPQGIAQVCKQRHYDGIHLVVSGADHIQAEAKAHLGRFYGINVPDKVLFKEHVFQRDNVAKGHRVAGDGLVERINEFCYNHVVARTSQHAVALHRLALALRQAR